MPREKTMDVRKIVSITAEMAQRIADFRFEQRLSTESEAIRLLIERGLEVSISQADCSAGDAKLQ